MPEAESIRSFSGKLEEVAAGLRERELPVDRASIKRYCELTGHDFASCERRDRLPVGFFMTLTSPILTQVIFTFFSRFPGVINGFIHTSSSVKMFAPLRLSSRYYTENLLVRDIQKKAGRKGSYFAVDFEITLTDDRGAKVATDMHQFFLRT